MMHFDRLNLSQTSNNQAQINQSLKAWADNLIDSLELLDAQLEDMQKEINKLESEVK